jgi:hypothetical protein
MLSVLFIFFAPRPSRFQIFANLQKVLIPSSQLCKTVFYGLSGFYLSCCNKSSICQIHGTLNNSLPIYHSKPLLLFLHFCK